MSLGFGQIIVILFVGFILFGNLPQRIKDLGKGLQNLKKELNSNKDEKGRGSGE